MIKIAMIGSGIAGLTAAYRTSSCPNAKVTLFEKQAGPGIDAHGVEIFRNGQRVSVDVPSRMFNSAQWPNLSRLYEEIGVQSLPVDSSQSFSLVCNSSLANQCHDRMRTYLRLDDATQAMIPFRELIWSSNRVIAKQTIRFLRIGTEYLKNDALDRSAPETLRAFLTRHGFRNPFVDRFLYPTLSSTVCTCSYPNLDRFPAQVVLETLANLIRPQHLLRTRFGTSDVANRLRDDRLDIVNHATVDQICDEGSFVRVNMNDGQSLVFDHVVVATQANTALSMLSSASPQERDVLRSIRYDEVPVVVHTDLGLMPRRRSKWSTFNILTEPTPTSASCTVWLNRFYGNWNLQEPIFQTIGTPAMIHESQVIRRTTLHRSVVDHRSLPALDHLDRLHAQLDRRVWFCGSWASRGLPLLESAVVSANCVADRLTRCCANLRLLSNERR